MPNFLPPLPLFTTVPSSAPPKRPNSHRALHLQNVLSLLHLSLLRQDYPRARRAWKILATCREVGWEGTYRFEGALRRGLVEEEADGEGGKEREEWLEGLRRGGGREVIPLLQTYVYHLLALNPPQPTKALDTLEIYITSIPYAASPALHGLAALCALGKSLETPPGAETKYDHATAKKYIHTALDLLPEHELASSSDEEDDHRPNHPTKSTSSTRPFYLSLLKLADDISRWGPGGNRVRGRGGGGGDMDESDDSSGSNGSEEGEGGDEGRRKKSRTTSRSNSAAEEGEGRVERMEESDEGEGLEEEKRDERHESLSEGEGDREGMMDLS